MKKPLPDTDKGHPFYSEEALHRWKKRIKELEQEEKELLKKRRKNKSEANTELPNT